MRFWIFFFLIKINDGLDLDDQADILASDVAGRYFSSKCIVVVKDEDKMTNLSISNSVILISTSNLCEDKLAYEFLVAGFLDRCDGFIIRISNPECFLKVWTSALFETLQRPNPKIFFLPAILDEPTNISNVVYSMRETEISEKILVAEYSGDEDWPFLLYTNNFAVTVGTPGRVYATFLDRWSLSGFENKNDLYPDKIDNMHGKRLRVMTFDYVPYTHKDPFEGFEAYMLLEFCRIHNCTLEVVDDGVFWGSIYKNGTGDGQFGMIYTDKADFGIAATYLWKEEFFYIDYSTTYLKGAVTLLVPKQELLSGWRIPFLPFDLIMWCIIAAVVIVSAFALHLVNRLTIRYTKYGDAIIKKDQFLTIGDSILRVVGMAVLQQPSEPLIPNTPIRYLFTSLEILFLVLTSLYGAELASYLTVPQYTKPIDTFHELAARKFQWLAVHEAFSYSLKFSDDPEVKTVVENFHVFTGEELIKATQSGKYGLTLERCPSGHYSEHDHITDAVIETKHIMAENLFGSPLVTVVRKASPYKEKLDKLIGKLLETGMFIIWETKAASVYLTSRKQIAIELSRSTTGKDEPTNLTIGHVLGPFMIYGAGTLMAIVAFFFEFFHGRNKNRIKKFG